MFSIDAIMSTDLVTIAPTSSLAEARSLMQEHRIHHLPVVKTDRTLIGLLTLTDVLAASDSKLRDADSRIHARDICIREVMVTDVITVDRRASLRQAALFIEKHKIGCLPVVESEKLIGIITDTDFVGVAINLLEQLEDSEPPDDELDEADVA
ncbi:MAG: CBS domain-containing protein [Woeseiaceae bacterium]|nr:CBS domain-containing protein [Woeseiaceae bacterium]